MALIPAWMWRDAAAKGIEHSGWRLSLRHIARLTMGVLRDISTGQHSLYAASLVYTTLVAMVPLLALSFSVVKSFGGANMLGPFLHEILAPLGPQGEELVPRLTEFVNNINVGVLGAVGLAFLIISVLALMQKIENAFNYIWRVSMPRRFVSRVRDHLSVLLVGPLLIFLSMGMTASLRYEDTLGRWLGIDGLDTVAAQVLALVPWVLFTLAFTAIYLFMPNTRVRLIPALVAGVLTAVGWKLLGWGFGLFVAQSANYAAIYSAFAVLILLMLWLYMAWLLLLAGATVAYYLQNPLNLRLDSRMGGAPAAEEKALCLLILADMARSFYATPPDTLVPRQLSARWQTPLPVIEAAISRLVTAGLVIVTPQGLFPARPFDVLNVADMLLAVEGGGETDYRKGLPPSLAQLLGTAEAAVYAELSGVTVREVGVNLARDMQPDRQKGVR